MLQGGAVLRHLFVVVALLLSSGSALAQSTSVMIDDLTTTEVQAAIDAGNTTAVYYVGGTHQNGAAVALGKHNLIVGIRHPKLSTNLYLIMGWAVLVVIRPLVLSLPPEGLRWLVAGGLSYSLGVVFYSARRLPYNHLIWHLFVLAGSTCHFFAVLWYAA